MSDIAIASMSYRKKFECKSGYWFPFNPNWNPAFIGFIKIQHSLDSFTTTFHVVQNFHTLLLFLNYNQDVGPGGPNLTTNHLLNTVTFILSLKMTDYDKSVFGGQVKTH